MSAITQRAIDRAVSRLRREHLHDLADHDRAMRSRRRLAAGQHLGHIVCEACGIVFLVLLRELPRMCPAISSPAFRFLGGVGHGGGDDEPERASVRLAVVFVPEPDASAFRLIEVRGINYGH